jgi:hypothetical protein
MMFGVALLQGNVTIRRGSHSPAVSWNELGALPKALVTAARSKYLHQCSVAQNEKPKTLLPALSPYLNLVNCASLSAWNQLRFSIFGIFPAFFIQNISRESCKRKLAD